MRKWLVACSTDGNGIDHEEIIASDDEPGFWEMYDIASEHGCEWFTCDELDDDEEVFA